MKNILIDIYIDQFVSLDTPIFVMDQIIMQIITSPDFKEGEKWEKKYYKVNDVIVKANEKAETFFYVQEGTLRVNSFVQLEGKKQMQTGISILQVGNVFGESCLNHVHKRIASVVAATDCCLIEINGKAMIEFLDQYPELGYRFFKKLFSISLERLNNANIRVGKLMAWGLKVYDIEKYL